MVEIDLSGFNSLNRGRVEKLLRERYRRNGVVATLREFIENGEGRKTKVDCITGVSSNRWYTALNEAGFKNVDVFKKASNYYSYDIDMYDVPKLVFDAVVGNTRTKRNFTTAYWEQLNFFINQRNLIDGFDPEVVSIIKGTRVPDSTKIGDVLQDFCGKWKVTRIDEDRRCVDVEEVGGDGQIRKEVPPFAHIFDVDLNNAPQQN